MLSVVIPTLNAAATLPAVLRALVPAAVDGLVKEVIVSDGGSTDQTLDLAEAAGCRILSGAPGRGGQLRRACDAVRADHLLVLHADTTPAAGWSEAARDHLNHHPGKAGYFGLRFDASGLAPRLWEKGVALRCRALGLPYGDQGLLLSRALYEDAGGYPDIPLMEDVVLARSIGGRRLRWLGVCAVTSARRYERRGWVATSLSNLTLLTRFALGADPHALARRYG